MALLGKNTHTHTSVLSFPKHSSQNTVFSLSYLFSIPKGNILTNKNPTSKQNIYDKTSHLESNQALWQKQKWNKG